MEPTRELIDGIERDRFERARKMTPGERLLEGPRLFDMACRWALAGIRKQYPDASEQRVQEILEERLRKQRELDELPLPEFPEGADGK